MKKEYSKIPFDVIVKASDGDTEAINKVIKHYNDLIASHSLRIVKDDIGNQYKLVDEELRGRLITCLITKILSFDIDYSA